jgi:hypothetical protein
VKIKFHLVTKHAIVSALAIGGLWGCGQAPQPQSQVTSPAPTKPSAGQRKPVAPSPSAPTTKETLFLMKLRGATDKQGWLIDSFIEGNALIVRGYLTVVNGAVRAGHADHPVFEGDLSKLRAEEKQDRSNPDLFFNVDPLFYRGSPINSRSNCAFFRANGFARVQARDVETGQSWDLCGGRKQSHAKK